MNRFTIAAEIATRVPTMRVVTITNYDLNDTSTQAEVSEFAEVSHYHSPRMFNDTPLQTSHPPHFPPATATHATNLQFMTPSAKSSV